MSQKQATEIIKAMMYTSGLSPQFEDDYYEGLSGTSIGLFFEGVVSYFKIERNSWSLHFASIEYLDTPSSTIDFFEKNLSRLIAANQKP